MLYENYTKYWQYRKWASILNHQHMSKKPPSWFVHCSMPPRTSPATDVKQEVKSNHYSNPVFSLHLILSKTLAEGKTNVTLPRSHICCEQLSPICPYRHELKVRPPKVIIIISRHSLWTCTQTKNGKFPQWQKSRVVTVDGAGYHCHGPFGVSGTTSCATCTQTKNGKFPQWQKSRVVTVDGAGYHCHGPFGVSGTSSCSACCSPWSEHTTPGLASAAANAVDSWPCCAPSWPSPSIWTPLQDSRQQSQHSNYHQKLQHI